MNDPVTAPCQECDLWLREQDIVYMGEAILCSHCAITYGEKYEAACLKADKRAAGGRCCQCGKSIPKEAGDYYFCNECSDDISF